MALQNVNNTRYLYDENTLKLVKYALATIVPAQTDSALVAAVAGKRIKVLSAVMQCSGATITTTFNTKPGGAGTAISPGFQFATNGNVVLPLNEKGYFQTAVGEGLSVTTGASAGTNVGILIAYIEAEA